MSRIVVRHSGYGVVYGSAAAQRRRAAARELRRIERSLPTATVGSTVLSNRPTRPERRALSRQT